MSDFISFPNAASAGVTPTRREVLSGLGLAVASLASTADADPVPPARAFRGAHAPKPLPFDPTKLTGISEKLIRSHWENNYSGAVKALNAVEDRLATAMADKDLLPYLYGDWKREELVRTGSVVLHENYFANLGGDGKPSGAALALVKEWFASYDAWEAEFRRVGMALSGARDGWCWRAISTPPKCTTTGCGTTSTSPPSPFPFSCSTCTSTPTRWTTARPRASTSTLSSRTSTGTR